LTVSAWGISVRSLLAGDVALDQREFFGHKA
jgi:hypothetical protein